METEQQTTIRSDRAFGKLQTTIGRTAKHNFGCFMSLSMPTVPKESNGTLFFISVCKVKIGKFDKLWMWGSIWVYVLKVRKMKVVHNFIFCWGFQVNWVLSFLDEIFSVFLVTEEKNLILGGDIKMYHHKKRQKFGEERIICYGFVENLWQLWYVWYTYMWYMFPNVWY